MVIENPRIHPGEVTVIPVNAQKDKCFLIR